MGGARPCCDRTQGCRHLQQEAAQEIKAPRAGSQSPARRAQLATGTASRHAIPTRPTNDPTHTTRADTHTQQTAPTDVGLYEAATTARTRCRQGAAGTSHNAIREGLRFDYRAIVTWGIYDTARVEKRCQSRRSHSNCARCPASCGRSCRSRWWCSRAT